MSTSQIKALEDFIQLQNRNAICHTIRASVELGIIKALTAGQKTVTELAEELDLKPEPLARLMSVLAETELVEQYDQHFALSTIARLIPEPFLGLGDPYWQQLSAHVKSGIPLPDDPAQPATQLDYVINKATEEWTLTPAAIDAALVLDIGKSRRGLRILEVECGSAVFGVTMAHRDPDSALNLVDTAAGLERAKKTVESVGLQRVELIEVETLDELGSLPELKGQQFDLVVVAGLIHRRNRDQVEGLLRQLHGFVKPDRELALIDIFPGQDEGTTQCAVFELELGLRTSHGRLHNPNEVKTSLQSAGFENIQYAHLPSVPFYWGLFLGRRG